MLPTTRAYLEDHRHDDRYDARLLQELESTFRADFPPARELQASFSDVLRGKLVKRLREDDPDDPLSFDEYDELLTVAEHELEEYLRTTALLETRDSATPYDQVWAIVQEYATWIGDDDLLDAYRETLQQRPWEQCECPICTEHGIEVCIFRGNDRNRRRGFHNTHRFYTEFTDALPKIAVATQGTAGLSRSDTMEDYLRDEHPTFWRAVHDLPVAEVGVVDASGIREWWNTTPSVVSFDPNRIAENVGQHAHRYQQLFLHTPDGEVDCRVAEAVKRSGVELRSFDDPEALREGVLEACGQNYVAGTDFVPHPPQFDTRDDLNILVVDQCSGSKAVPDDAPIFDADETLAFSKEALLGRDNVPAIAAADLYTGRQQEYVADAVRHLRRQGHGVDRYFVSAGFGLVAEDEPLPPYEVTFSGMNVGQIRARSEQLHVQDDLHRVLARADYDIVFFTLGSTYYTSIDIDDAVQKIPANTIGVVFNRELVDQQFDNIVSVPARTADAKEHGTIVIGLKGLYLKNFAHRIGSVGTLKPNTVDRLCRHVEEEPVQAAFGNY